MKYLTFIIFSFLAVNVISTEKNLASKDKEKDLQRFEELTKIILKGSFKERKVAIEELNKLEIDLNIIIERAKNETDPELKLALTKVIDRRIIWSDVKEEKWKEYPVFGVNDDGKNLYLVKATIDDEVVIGKVWQGAIGHFPHKGKEVLVENFKIWHNPGQWRPWNKDLQGMKVLGLTKDGKKLYAARARFEEGVHIGVFVEGSDKAQIPWGGISHDVKDFEILVEENTPGESKLDSVIKNF